MYIPWIQVIGFLIVAIVCAAIAQSLARFSLIGFLVSLIGSFAGAWFAVWLVGVFDLPPMLQIGSGDGTIPVVWAVIGGLFLALVTTLIIQRLLIHTVEETVEEIFND